jgi:hypothetical protein
VSDIDIAVVDSLKALDPKWPIREADIAQLDKFKEPNGLNENLGKTDQPVWDLAGAA